MALQRYSAVEQHGVPIQFPDGTLIDTPILQLLYEAGVQPELVQPTPTIEITPSYWLPEILTTLEIEDSIAHPDWARRYFLTSHAAGSAVIQSVGQEEPDLLRLEADPLYLLEAFANRTIGRANLPDPTKCVLIHGPSDTHGGVEAIHELIIDI